MKLTINNKIKKLTNEINRRIKEINKQNVK